MRLTTKVYLATTLVATIGAASIGTSNIILSYESKVSSIRAVMLENMSLIDGTSVDAIEDAITVGEGSTVPISISYVNPDGASSLIHDDGSSRAVVLTSKQLSAATLKPTEYGSQMIGVLNLVNGGNLIFSSSVQEAQEERTSDLNRTLILYVVTLFGMVLLVWLTLRRDLRSIRRINSAALKLPKETLRQPCPTREVTLR